MVGIVPLLVLALIGGHHAFATEAVESTTHVVVMENMPFSPRVLKVGVGDRIEYKKRGPDAAHRNRETVGCV